jgi:prevent-host-death family protein
MTDTVNIYDAKTNLSELADRAAGQKIIIAQAGKPKAKLVPYRTKKKAPWRTESAGNYLHRRGFRCSAAARNTEIFRVGGVRVLIDTHILL